MRRGFFMPARLHASAEIDVFFSDATSCLQAPEKLTGTAHDFFREPSGRLSV